MFGGALADHFIKELRIVGVPDPLYGEKIMLCIATGESTEMIKAVVSRVNEAQDSYHRVSKIYLTENGFPKTANGKIDDKHLIEEAFIHGTITV